MPERSRTTRNPHAVALGRRGGLIGGKARAKRLSAEQRSEKRSRGGNRAMGSRPFRQTIEPRADSGLGTMLRRRDRSLKISCCGRKRFGSRPHWLRPSIWEALSAPTHWVAGSERRNSWRAVVRDVERQQNDGMLPAIDAAQLQLTILAVVMFPYLLPQMTEFITGIRADSDAFVATRAEFLRNFAAILTRGNDAPAR